MGNKFQEREFLYDVTLEDKTLYKVYMEKNAQLSIYLDSKVEPDGDDRFHNICSDRSFTKVLAIKDKKAIAECIRAHHNGE